MGTRLPIIFPTYLYEHIQVDSCTLTHRGTYIYMFLWCSSQGQLHGKVPTSRGPGHLPGQEWVLLIPFYSFPYSLKPKSGKGPRCQNFPSMKGRQSRRAPWTDTAGKDIFFLSKWFVPSPQILYEGENVMVPVLCAPGQTPRP